MLTNIYKLFERMTRRKKAFTLAEALITISIVGFIAVLTIPTLIKKYNEKVIVTNLKQSYSILNQAYKLVVAEHGEDISSWEFIDSSRPAYSILNEFSKHIKINKLCDIGENNCSLHSDYILKGKDSETPSSFQSSAKALLPNGSIIYLEYNSHPNSCTTSKTWLDNKDLKNICGTLCIDTNGNAKPNTLAVDIFNFYFTRYSIYPAGTDDNFVRFNTYCTNDMYGINWGCTYYVLKNGKLDYLK